MHEEVHLGVALHGWGLCACNAAMYSVENVIDGNAE